MTEDDLHAELARVRAENEHLKRQQSRGLHLKVSEKGFVRLTLRAAQYRDAHSTIPLPSASLSA